MCVRCYCFFFLISFLVASFSVFICFSWKLRFSTWEYVQQVQAAISVIEHCCMLLLLLLLFEIYLLFSFLNSSFSFIDQTKAKVDLYFHFWWERKIKRTLCVPIFHSIRSQVCPHVECPPNKISKALKIYIICVLWIVNNISVCAAMKLMRAKWSTSCRKKKKLKPSTLAKNS